MILGPNGQPISSNGAAVVAPNGAPVTSEPRMATMADLKDLLARLAAAADSCALTDPARGLFVESAMWLSNLGNQVARLARQIEADRAPVDHGEA